MLEQAFKKETDGMNDYLEEYYLQNNVKEGLSPPMGETDAISSSESKLVDNRVIASDEQLQSSQIQSHLLLSSAKVSVGNRDSGYPFFSSSYSYRGWFEKFSFHSTEGISLLSKLFDSTLSLLNTYA